jgi:hypothetical protein
VFRKKQLGEKPLSVQICNKKKRRRIWDGYSSSFASSLRLTILLGLSFVSRIKQAKLHLIAVSWLWNLMHACSNWISAVVFSVIEGWWWCDVRERERSSLLIPDLISLATGAEEEQQGCRTTCSTNNWSSLGCTHLILLCLSGSCCQGWIMRRVRDFQYFCLLLPSALVEFLLPSLDSSYGVVVCGVCLLCLILSSCVGRLGFVTLSCFHLEVG